MEDMDVVIESRTNVDIYIDARQRRIWMKLVKEEVANEIRIESLRAIDIEG
jgi:hypothetical protein